MNLEGKLLFIGKIIFEKKHELAKFITAERNSLYPEQFAPKTNELLDLRVELVEIYSQSLSLHKNERMVVIEKWGNETGRKCAEMGLTLGVMLNSVPNYRHVIGEIIKEIAIKEKFSLEDLYMIMTKFDDIVNDVVFSVSLPFVEYKQDQLKLSQNNEFSVLFVPITDSVSILPIIGNIDTYRVKIILEQAMDYTVREKVDCLLIDLSRVPVIDTFVADQLLYIIYALRLLGVKTTISGLTPTLAQEIIQKRIDFSSVKTFSTIKQALAEQRLV